MLPDSIRCCLTTKPAERLDACAAERAAAKIPCGLCHADKKGQPRSVARRQIRHCKEPALQRIIQLAAASLMTLPAGIASCSSLGGIMLSSDAANACSNFHCDAQMPTSVLHADEGQCARDLDSRLIQQYVPRLSQRSTASADLVLMRLTRSDR